MGEPETVLVSGASGYIANHLIRNLLTEGKYKVRGTVRNVEARVKPVRDLEPEGAKYSLELVQADLTDKESWIEAVRGCTYVYHMASPFPGSGNELTPELQQERIIKPAVDGTLNVLKACAEVGGVKRVVMTSSMAAISSGMHGIPGKPKNYKYSEEDWSDESACSPYELSKVKAEEAAWEFMKDIPEDKRFELAVVNPVYVQGPLLSSASGGGTQLVCTMLLTGKLPAIPDVTFPIVDVRDVVAVHRATMEKPDAAGKRFLAYTDTISFKEYATIIREEFKSQGYSIPSMPLPKFGMWIFKFFDQTAKETYDIWGVKLLYNNDRMKSLGIEPRPIKDTILETCYSLIELGLVQKKPRYRNPTQAAGGAEGEDKPAESPEKPEELGTMSPEGEEKPAAGEKNPAEGEEKPAETDAAET